MFTDSQLLSIFESCHSEADVFLMQVNPNNDEDFSDDDVRVEYARNNKMWDELGDETIAVMLHANCDVDDVNLDNYMLLTDEEADAAVEEYANNYLEDIVLSEIPIYYQSYFDGDDWVADYISNSTRGEILGSYDGYEHEVILPSGNYLYLYKQ